MKIDPTNKIIQSEIENFLGKNFSAEGDHQNAIKHYTEAIKLTPNDAVSYCNRALCYNALKNTNLLLRIVILVLG